MEIIILVFCFEELWSGIIDSSSLLIYAIVGSLLTNSFVRKSLTVFFVCFLALLGFAFRISSALFCLHFHGSS